MYKIYLVAVEDLKNNKIKNLIFFFIILGQGLISAASVYFMPELLAGTGIPAKYLPEASAEMAFSESLENLFLMGTLIVILMTMQIFASDIELGTIYFTLSRPIKRYEYILGNLISKFIVLSVTLIVSIMGFYIYSGVLFGTLPKVKVTEAILTFILLFLFVTTVTAMLSTRVTSLTSALLTLLVILAFWYIPSIIHDLRIYSPFYLQEFEILEELEALLYSIFWILGFILISIVGFQKRDL